MRKEGWERLLIEYIEAARNTSFQWGKHDCALWAGQWVDLATGTDHASKWLGKYKTEAGAARLMKRRGFLDTGDIITDYLTPRGVLMARRGDLVLHEQNSVGICAGMKCYFLTQNGLTDCLTGDCIRAWAVD